MRLGFLAILSLALAAPAGAAVIDSFDDVSQWHALPADGVGMTLSGETGEKGGALRFDFRFAGGGYAVARRELPVDLPENYRITFRIRGVAPVNHVEFKLVDSTGSNVWWHVKRDFAFPREWETVAIKKRQISFAWGPAGGGELRRAAAIEIAITAGSGGTGTVWLDELTIEPLPPPRATPPEPVASASSSLGDSAPAAALDGDSTTAWRPSPSDRTPWFALDLGEYRELGGLRLEWLPDHPARDYDVEAQLEGESWRVIRGVRGGDGKLDLLHLPESEARRLRVRLLSASAEGAALRTARVLPVSWAPTVNDYFMELAKQYPRGWFPRGFSGEQSYWTVVGEDSAPDEILFSEDGALELHKSGFSIEPFVFADGRLRTWADAEIRQQLALPDSLPSVRGPRTGARFPEDGTIQPTVHWSVDSLHLEIAPLSGMSASVDGPVVGKVRYRVQNLSLRRRRVGVYAAIRPFQVNPPSQFLNTTGGASFVRSVHVRDGRGNHVTVNDSILLIADPVPHVVARPFDAGLPFDDIELVEGSWSDPQARGTVILKWSLDLEPAAVGRVELGWQTTSVRHAPAGSWEVPRFYGVQPPDLEPTLLAQLRYILINRDGAAIQPGSRAYERSWIRDGAMTSSALLRMGLDSVVRDYLNWFAGFQYDNGKIPCCVDARGADPVPEHDSGGEFLFLLAEYLRYTNDQATIAPLWPRVGRAVAYLDTLRQQRRTPEWRTPDNAHFFGLLPPSISHEGYSAKPMHSYWDDFWALRGFRDAVFLAEALGYPQDAHRFRVIATEFEGDLRASIPAAMAKHRIDYVPGCADLGDFDATSTTIALNPVQADDVPPPGSLERTFERYWEFFVRRRDGLEAWEAYTPYEIRNIGAFVQLGWRDRAHDLLDWFLKDRRPVGWLQWPEVIRKDPRQPAFLGDLPHTWVGSDYIRSVLDMFAFDDESRRRLVLAAGIPSGWLEEGIPVGVRDLRTPYGKLGYWITRRGPNLEVEIEQGLGPNIESIVLRAPGVDAKWKVKGGGSNVSKVDPKGDVHVRSVPARFTLEAPTR